MKGYQRWIEYSKDLELHPDNYPYIPYPSQFVLNLSADELWEKGYVDGLVACYQEVFGSDEYWGEGAYCSAEGWKKLIPLDEYKRRIKNNDLLCGCGGVFLPCYPKVYLESSFLSELDSEKSLCQLMLSPANQVVGFMMASILSIDEISKKILKNPSFVCIYDFWGVIKKIQSYLSEFIFEDMLIMYFSEAGIIESFRQGLEPVLFLYRACLEKLVRGGDKSVICWSYPNSKIYNLARLTGSEVICQNKDICVLYNANVIGVCRALQYFYPKHIAGLMKKESVFLSQ